MAFAIADRIWEQTSTTIGVGAVTLPAVAVAGGYRTFLNGWGASGSGWYVIFGGNQWEAGEGTINAGGTSLTRTTVFDGSSGVGVTVNFSAGVKQIISDVPASIVQSIVSSIHGQCRLTKSGANLLLSPWNGNKLVVNGVLCTIPDAGVTLAPTALTPGTLYYIYATASAARVIDTLEASTTGHTPSTAANNKGIEAKAGDNSRTFVGIARPIAGPAWADTATQRFMRSWFNDPGIMAKQTGVTGTGITSTSSFDFNSAKHTEFLCWADEPLSFMFSGFGFNTTTGAVLALGIGIDSTTTSSSAEAVTQGTASNSNNLNNTHVDTLAEGYHFIAALARVTTATNASVSAGTLALTSPGR